MEIQYVADEYMLYNVTDWQLRDQVLNNVDFIKLRELFPMDDLRHIIVLWSIMEDKNEHY